MTQTAILQALRQPGIYPDAPMTVEVRETHISVVFLTEEYVYKLKKAVNLGFLDYATLERRHYYCLQELLLNRRLSRGVYLDVLPLYQHGVEYTFMRIGPVVEYVLRMRRLPEHCQLTALLARDAAAAQFMNDLAHTLVSFHTAHAPPSRQVGTLQQVQRDWQENFVQTRSDVGHTLSSRRYDLLQHAVTTFMSRHARWFEERVSQGRIRDCHGDLRAEHIYVQDGMIQIIDCIEFNAHFRYIDVASEVAFLSMDLERLGFQPSANAFVRSYVAHAHDLTLYRLLDFYRCYRAYVRGKVASIRWRDRPAPQIQVVAQQEAEHYFRLAEQYARRLTRPVVIITTGLIGSGKSSIAAALAAALDLQNASSDIVRKTRAGLSPQTPHHVAYGTDLYSPAASHVTYAILTERAQQALERGESIILDAAFSRHEDRRRIGTLAQASGADFFVVECWAPVPVLQERLEQRAQATDVISDGRLDILAEFQRHYEPVQASDGTPHVRLDTQQPLEVCVQQALAALQEERP
jgi:aminoglycoside phosphotransferase family enzyme/predicted kinase